MNEEVRAAIVAGRGREVLGLVRGLGAAERKAVAKELPKLLREVREASQYGLIDAPVADALLLAGLATIGGAAGAASWLARADLRWWTRRWERRSASSTQPPLTLAVEDRSDEWVADVVRRAAARIRDRWQDEGLWHAVAALVPRAGGAPPSDEGFVLGWTRWGPGPYDVARDPFADALVPRLFEVDGAGDGTWVAPLAEFVASGRLDRSDALDGCVRRLLRGGRPQDLRWFCELYDALAPTVDEAAARLRDLVRLLPAASGGAAVLALREIRRVDEAAPIPLDAFAEAVEGAVFRPEKRLVRSALVWANRTAGRDGRADAAVLAVLPLFQAEDLDLRERAVKLVRKHAGAATVETRDAALGAAASLPADLRALIPGFEPSVEGEEPRVFDPLPPYSPPVATPPIRSAAELVEAMTTVLGGTGWNGFERVMAGLVECAYRDPDGTRAAVSELAQAQPWYFRAFEPNREDDPRQLLGRAVDRLGNLGHEPAGGKRALAGALRARLRQLSKTPPERWERRNTQRPAPIRFLIWRMLEAVEGLGRTPFLLAVPTEGNGLIAPDVLVERALRYEADGLEIGRADLAQALLRTPPEVSAEVLKKAGELRSERGRALAEHLGADVPPSPAITLAPVTIRRRGHPYYSRQQQEAVRLLPTVVPAVPGQGIADAWPLFTLPDGEGWSSLPSLGYWPGYDELPRIMPTHREVAAAHLLPAVSGLPEIDAQWALDAVDHAVLALAEADGPAGPATAAVLAYAASAKKATARATALEALLVLASRNLLPAADLGRTIATLAGLGGVKLNRIVGVLADAAHAGAHAEVWEAAREALPPLLAASATAPAPPGLGDLVQIAARCAEALGVRADLPGLADTAARGGTSRLVREARRLQRTLARAG
ncbi:DUF6493 family protein [Actinomadura gamaensis]|uniref:DUF6493 family protein n=1 Tax=Actinomadura gamaensis TaxID=1763541 RepID=A0ABV9U865_9ACTN